MTNKEYELEDLLKHSFAEEGRCPVFKEEKIFSEDVLSREFEFNSHGARVEGELYYAPQTSTQLIIICKSHLENSCDFKIEAIAKAWTKRGALLARVEIPLQGRRENPKLTEHLFGTLKRNGELSTLDQSLWRDYFQQAQAELSGLIEILPGPINADIQKVNFLGFDLGAACGIGFCSNSNQHIQAAFIGLDEVALKGPSYPIEGLRALTSDSFMVGHNKDRDSVFENNYGSLRKLVDDDKILIYSGDSLSLEKRDTIWNFFNFS